MNPLRTLLVDDNQTFAASAAGFLSGRHDVEVVGCAHSAQEAFRMIEETAPDLVLMDVAMPDIDGFEATLKIKAGPKPPLVVILTLHDYPEYRDKARAIGADGFVSKAEFGTKLLPLIDSFYTAPAR